MTRRPPEVVLKLSDILRYVIYDSAQDKVLLSSELSLLRKYIDLQKHRIESEASITLTNGIVNDVKVAPLIFLTLLENSFKHGIKNDIENVFINAKVYSDSQKVYFEIENNRSENEEKNAKFRWSRIKKYPKKIRS